MRVKFNDSEFGVRIRILRLTRKRRGMAEGPKRSVLERQIEEASARLRALELHKVLCK